MIRPTESKKYRYEMRNEIEHIIKNQKIDRNLFHEVAKWDYERVIRKMYYSFCNYKKYPTVQVSYMWTRFRENLKSTELICTDWTDWNFYISQIEELLPKKKRSFFYYLLVDGGWVYEGTLENIQRVLKEYPIYMDDFYIMPKIKETSWMIVHCEDGACMCRVWNYM